MRRGLKLALNCLKLNAERINGSSERRWWSGACVQLPTLHATVAVHQPCVGGCHFVNECLQHFYIQSPSRIIPFWRSTVVNLKRIVDLWLFYDFAFW